MLFKHVITLCLILGMCCAFEEVKQVENEEEIMTTERDTELERTETEERVSNILEVSSCILNTIYSLSNKR